MMTSNGGDATAERERHVDELVMQLQPHPRAEAHRAAVFRHVFKMVRHVASVQAEDSGDECNIQVHRFGSVPLKTYLPHGDLDVTAFAGDDKWLQKLKEALEAQARQDDAQCVVSGVYSVPHDLTRPAHADIVKVVKCQVDGISVDISANALGGLYTLCLLEKVDKLVGDRHLFKRSMVLIKAWCYFEARILSSQNGLLATYALETLVLCIFNLFRPQLTTPIIVLAKFLEYFANFDWLGCCLTIRGPVACQDIKKGVVPPIPDAEPSTLLLSDKMLEEDPQLKALMLGPQEEERGFLWKHLNIADPLSNKNNLGRSVSRGNACRIRRAMYHGWRSLKAVLDDSSGSHGTIQTFFKYTVLTLAGNRPDVGDICITAADIGHLGTNTPSARSTDFSHSQQSNDTQSTVSRSSDGDTLMLSDEDDLEKDQSSREGGNTSLNTALNAILTQPTASRSEAGGEGINANGGFPLLSHEKSCERSEGDSYDSGDEIEGPAPPRNSWSLEGDVLAADLDELMEDLVRVKEAMNRLHGADGNAPVTVARSQVTRSIDLDFPQLK